MSSIKSNLDLASIRTGTKHDLADAIALAALIFSRERTTMDSVTLEFSKDLFVAVSLQIAYTKVNGTLKDVLDYISDPMSWDSEWQMLLFFRQSNEAFLQKETALWINGFMKKIVHLTAQRAEGMVKRCQIQWQTALNSTEEVTKSKEKQCAGLQVFSPESVAEALDMMCNLREEKKAGGDRILENALLNDGYRSVPNAKKAGLKLEEAKNYFENLLEPINRLQIDLVLAGAMTPENFSITPILLLGDPGIGKTHLATQLGKALGVSMDKISAGGAQGGFQLTGSHTSWQSARPGSLFSTLAKGKSAAPVIVIDEVDKIRDSQYPVLPVLLDLFEPDTAKRFKDEFFEMEFDASRIIFVLTANSLDGVPTSLLSRVEVFNVPRPEPKQRLRIIQHEAAQLCFKTQMNIKLDQVASEMLAERIDLDLRKTTRLVKEAFARAMYSGESIAKLLIPKITGPRSIGF